MPKGTPWGIYSFTTVILGFYNFTRVALMFLALFDFFQKIIYSIDITSIFPYFHSRNTLFSRRRYFLQVFRHVTFDALRTF